MCGILFHKQRFAVAAAVCCLSEGCEREGKKDAEKLHERAGGDCKLLISAD